jgi:hypothetical protein
MPFVALPLPQDIMNSIDLCAIVPYFITLATVLTEDKEKDETRILRAAAGQEKGASLGKVSLCLSLLLLEFHSHDPVLFDT